MSLLAGSGYPISRSSGRCAATGRQLEVDERYVATLVEREGHEELERVDFCIAAWESGARPQGPVRLFASWRAAVPEPTARKNAFLSDDELLELLEQLAEATEARRVAFRYLLALILVRRKALKYEGTRDGVMTVRVRTLAGAPEAAAMKVFDPNLDEETISGAMEQLGEIMAFGGPTSPGPKAPT